MFGLETKTASVGHRQPACQSRADRDDGAARTAACGSLAALAGGPPATLELGGEEVDIWCCLLDDNEPSALASALDAGEMARYRGFVSADAARQFLAGRVLVRAALSCYARVPARAWRFAVNEHGRPGIDEPRAQRGLHFNLSHTAGAAVLGLARMPEIGIDVEAVDRPLDIEWVGRSVFTQSESSWIAAGPWGSERDRFFDLWTLKEAYIKARGRGFSLRPSSFELAHRDGRFLLQCAPDCDPNPERWQFRLSSPRPGLRMALAIGSRSATCRRSLTCRLSLGADVPGE